MLRRRTIRSTGLSLVDKKRQRIRPAREQPTAKLWRVSDPEQRTQIERQVDKDRFKSRPIEIIRRFLEAFDFSDEGGGEQVHQPRKHVMEALARRLHAVVVEGQDIGKAFGHIRRQLQNDRTDERAYSVTFEIQCLMACGVGHDKALEQTAMKLHMSID